MMCWVMIITLLLWAPAGVLALEFEAARHLLARTSFGGTLADLESLQPLSSEAAVERLLNGVRAHPHTAPPAWVDEPRPTLLERRTMTEEEQKAFRTMRQPQQFLERASQVQPATVRTSNRALAYILAIQNESSHAATLLQDKLAGSPEPDASFPSTPIGRQLQVVTRLLTSRTPVAVLKVSHGSFDTHSNQRDTHNRLLRELAEALAVLSKPR